MDRRPSKSQLLVQLFITLFLIWLTLPEHQRRSHLMRVVASSQKLTEHLAKRVARVGMTDELRGDIKSAQNSYDAAYGLMTGPRVRFQRAYDKLRGAT